MGMGELILEISGTAAGLLYVWLEIKHRRSMWIVGIVMSVCYIVVFGVEALYASMGLYVYYLGMSLYGWFKWGAQPQQKQPQQQQQQLQPDPNPDPNQERKPVHIDVSTAWVAAGLLAVGFGGVWAVLRFLTDHPAPAMDAAITILNMVATWLLTRSIVEQWLLLAVANILAIILYAHTGLWFTTGLYAVYLIASVIGYINWRRKI